LFTSLTASAYLFSSSGSGSLWGLVLSEDGTPLNAVLLSLENRTGSPPLSLRSGGKGFFQATGVTPGYYTLRTELDGFKSCLCGPVLVDPDQAVYIEIHMVSSKSSRESRSRIVAIDHTQNLHQTVLDSELIYGLPLAHNLWSLVENLDLSATANRIDVAGLYSGIPALFSARGGTSWTQSRTLLNGLDVTDPYTLGQPLLYPDFYGLSHTQLINAGHSAEFSSPGGVFNLITPQGGDQFHGGASAFFLNHSLQSSNISPELEDEGLFESHGFHYMLDGNVHLSGPLIPNKLHFFTSVSAFDLSRDIAEFPENNNSDLLSGTLGLTYQLKSSRFHVLWTGQRLNHTAYGAGRGVDFSATSFRNESFQAAQFLWNNQIRPHHNLVLSLGLVQGHILSEFQDGIPAPHSLDIFQQIPQRAAALASDDNRQTLTLNLKGDLWLASFLGARHRLKYGFSWQTATTSSQKEVWNNLHLRYYNSQPLEVVFYNTPLKHFESGRRFSLYLQDSVTFSSLVTLYGGVNVTSSKAWVPERSDDFAAEFSGPDLPPKSSGEEIDWLTFAPRFGIIIPLTPGRGAVLKLSYARSYYSLPLNYLTNGNPYALSGLAYTWEDSNQDGIFQEIETGPLLRREGPYYTRIDPNIKPPRSDEYIISFCTGFGRSWTFVLSGFSRNTRNLVYSENIGVPFSAYSPEFYIDNGDDQAPFTYDDLIFTVFNQNPETLGQDLYWLTNVEPDTRNLLYFGADVSLIKRFGDRFTFFLSLTATQADGSTNPGNSEFENDEGVVGALFNDPNTLINAKGRVRFDRAYTGRIGVNYLAPYDIRLGLVIKYYDGQPFARKIIIEGFNQGPFYIQANPRGISRYEYNRTMDVRLEKIFRLGGTSRLRVMLDGFNILNRGLATQENEWTRPEYPERYATEIQSPRIFRLGLAYEF
jgi:hypothetical protein